MQKIITREAIERNEGKFVKVTTRLRDQGVHLSTAAKWIYVVLKSFENNKTGRIFPSLETIIEHSGCSKRTVQRALKELEHFSWIVRRRNFQKSNDYVVTSPIVWATDESGNKTYALDQTCPTEQNAKAWRKEERFKDTETYAANNADAEEFLDIPF